MHQNFLILEITVKRIKLARQLFWSNYFCGIFGSYSIYTVTVAEEREDLAVLLNNMYCENLNISHVVDILTTSTFTLMPRVFAFTILNETVLISNIATQW